MKKILLLFAWVLVCIRMSGAPVYPFPVTVTQSDGTQLTIRGYGDEHFHYQATLDGVLLVEEGLNYYVGEVDALTGELRSTGQLAHEPSLRSAVEKKMIASQDRKLFFDKAERSLRLRAPRHEPVSQSGTLFPHTGSPKAVVILVEFTDTLFSLPNPRASFDQYLNSLKRPVDYGGGETRNISSVKHYFKTVSDEKFTPQFDVYGPVRLPHALKHYGGSSSTGKDEDIKSLVNDACQMMDDSLDFSQYDANDDGKIDLVYIIYAGYAQSITGNSNQCIWPKSGTTSGTRQYDGKDVARYGVNNELNGFPGAFGFTDDTKTAYVKNINGIGLFCHEFSHCMGLPDLYPTVKPAEDPDKELYNNQSMEYWSVMDLGEYLGNGYSPSEYTAWERECFGWTEIEELDPAQELDISTLSAGGKAYRITNEYDATGNEYYILENIQKDGFNYNMKGHGLVVTHVRYDASAFSLSGSGGNSVNNIWGAPRMTVIPADGLLFSNKYVDGTIIKNADFYNELAGDPFPGSKDVREVTEDSALPNLPLWTSAPATTAMHAPSATGNALERLCYVLSNIEETEDGVISLNKNHVLPGDVNGDGEVDVADFTCVAAHILGHTPEVFITRVADIAGAPDGGPDGDIDVADLTGIANIILHGNGGASGIAPKQQQSDRSIYILNGKKAVVR